MFYPDNAQDCEVDLKTCIPELVPGLSMEKVVAGIVPHAGWAYSGATAGKVYRAVAQTTSNPTFIIFGAVHVYDAKKASLWRQGSWISPVGEMMVDQELAEKILSSNSLLFKENPDAHRYEHSIEVQVPFLLHLFPKAKFVPIMVEPWEDAVEIGEMVAQISGPDVIAIASSDLTHYGDSFGFTPAGYGHAALQWVKDVNDRRLIDLILNLEAEKIVPEAMQNHSSCGSGAIAAAVAFARAKQKVKGQLLEYTTSWDVEQRHNPSRGTPQHFVGYAGIVF